MNDDQRALERGSSAGLQAARVAAGRATASDRALGDSASRLSPVGRDLRRAGARASTRPGRARATARAWLATSAAAGVARPRSRSRGTRMRAMSIAAAVMLTRVPGSPCEPAPARTTTPCFSSSRRAAAMHVARADRRRARSRARNAARQRRGLDPGAGQVELARRARASRRRRRRADRRRRRRLRARAATGARAPRRSAGAKSIDEPQPAQERRVEIALAVRREHGDRRRTAPCAAAGSRSRCWRTGRGRR